MERFVCICTARTLELDYTLHVPATPLLGNPFKAGCLAAAAALLQRGSLKLVLGGSLYPIWVTAVLSP